MADTETTFQSIPHLIDREQVTGTVNGRDVRSLWKSALLILVLTSLFVVYLLIKPGGPKFVNLGDNITQGLLEGIGLILTLALFLLGIGRTGNRHTSVTVRGTTVWQ